jgi:hypothetical protein
VATERLAPPAYLSYRPRMQRSHFPWALIAILVVGYVLGHTVGLILAALGLFVVYLASLRVHPRIRHRACGGTGEHRGSVFTWTHRKCPGCNGGRLVRRGAAVWGAEHIRNEYKRTKEARKTARQNSTWR